MDRSEAAHPCWADIDLEALERNYLNVQRRLKPGTHIICSIKADAYGHGAVAVAERLAAMGCHSLATGDIDEAIAMRRAGVRAKIIMFAGPLPEGLPEFLAHDLIPTVYDREGAEAVSRAATKSTPVYVKVDCGLGRLGVRLDEAAEYIAGIARLANIVIEGVYSHVPFATRATAEWSQRGLHAFGGLIAELARRGIRPEITQARASSGVLMDLDDSCNAVCVGHLLYGLSSMAPGEAELAGFEPILAAVRGRLVHVGRHPAGRDIAVGGLYGINSARTTGVLPMGMTNGLRMPATGNQAFALFRGRRVPVLSVSLEHTTLDLTDLQDLKVGEAVTVLGADGAERITIEDIAEWQGRAPLEVAMTLSKRLPFRHGNRADDVWANFGTN